GLVAVAFLAQLPQQERQRSPQARRDDLGAVARMLGAQLQPGDPLLYFPKTGRRYVEAYPASVAGLRDVSLRASGAASGTLYGLDVPPRELAARMDCLPRVWVLYDAEAGYPGWHTGSTGERAKLALLKRDFVPLTQVRRKSGLLVLYARVGGAAPGCAT
ncbi:hypothetical protein G3I40_21555, partial [Streptomyces sp. SID14478]|nr:hypothetical protein [Streptomyces sp. SID14478]